MLKPGDPLPKFELPDQHNKIFRSEDWIHEPLVIFFYPKDNTLVCTIEACGFRDQFEEFHDLGVQIVGISADSTSSHANFAMKHNLPFLLLSDENRKVERLFGLRRQFFGLLSSRATFIFDNGLLKQTFDSRWNGKGHVRAALEALR